MAETWDGYLNDINGFHVKPEHVVAGARRARSGGPVAEGNVGGGTGMICHEFKGGIGTRLAQRRRTRRAATRVGVLVQANYGVRDSLRIAGVPVGQTSAQRPRRTAGAETHAATPARSSSSSPPTRRCCRTSSKRLARRAGMGLARTGSYSGNGSGDIFLAFSTANRGGAPRATRHRTQAQFIGNDQLDGLFEATVQATEEAIVNAMVAARDMQGERRPLRQGDRHDALVRLLKQLWPLPPAKEMTRSKLFMAVLFAVATTPAFAQTIVVHAGHMVDVDNGNVLTDRAIMIDKGRIVRVEPWSDALARTRNSSTGRATPCCPA